MTYYAKDPVFVVGDLHGNFHWLKPWIEKYGLSNCSLVFCGDVGLGFKPLEEWYKWVRGLKLEACLKKNDIGCYFIRGNHDDPSWFDDKTMVTSYFKAVSDYSVISTPTHSILCIGGGISLDRSDRKLCMQFAKRDYMKAHPSATEDECESAYTHTYWPDEAPRYDEQAIDNLTYQIDTVCSHIAPLEMSPLFNPANKWFGVDPALRDDCYDERVAMTKVMEKLIANQHPLSRWYYGHYHHSVLSMIGEIQGRMLDMARDGTLCMKELK